MRGGRLRGVVALDVERQAQGVGRGRQQPGIGRHHDVGLPSGLRQNDAGIRPYPCGFTRRDDDPRYVHRRARLHLDFDESLVA